MKTSTWMRAFVVVTMAWGVGCGGSSNPDVATMQDNTPVMDQQQITDTPVGMDTGVMDDAAVDLDAATDGRRQRDTGNMMFTDTLLAQCFVEVTPGSGASGSFTANGRNFSMGDLQGRITDDTGSRVIGVGIPITGMPAAGGTFTFSYRITQSLPAGNYRFYARDGLWVCEAWGPFIVR